MPGLNYSKRFAETTTLGELKRRLYTVTGTDPASMKLEIAGVGDVTDQDATQLLAFGQTSLQVHVVDTDPLSIVNQTAQSAGDVPRYELDDQKYNERTDTFRFLVKSGQIQGATKHEEEAPTNIHTGERCQVCIAGKPRGTVRYVGAVAFAAGARVGVQFDEPVGKHDGTVKGKQYFACPPKYGAFFKPAEVEVGDFPERDLDDLV
eukprot:TRINITY_DN2789_c0_g1_i2.p1 TRINITY_DN2789_c0_g1~~TRINITY_DN2789_c0_g1_i2.p1  ORF type:complete len:220 (+),score=63.93 TRINITY_DN2789_c0_g1_i2:44-661(+)